MDPVSFDDQRYSAVTRTRAAHEPFSILGLLTRRGISPMTANIILLVIAVALIGFAVWFYSSNMPHKLSPAEIQSLHQSGALPSHATTPAR